MLHPEEIRYDIVEDFLPENYFCTFYEILDENIVWQVYFYRYFSFLNSETIELILSFEKRKDQMFNDDWLRDNSYITEQSITSRAYVDIDPTVKSVTIHVRNNFSVN